MLCQKLTGPNTSLSSTTEQEGCREANLNGLCRTIISVGSNRRIFLRPPFHFVFWCGFAIFIVLFAIDYSPSVSHAGGARVFDVVLVDVILVLEVERRVFGEPLVPTN
jgi:hypothetical protein